jgi:hypothetical protein
VNPTRDIGRKDHSKHRLLLVTSNPPEFTQGGSRLLYELLVGQDKFQIAVLTDKVGYSLRKGLSYGLKSFGLINYLRRTRLHKWVEDLNNFGYGWDYLRARRFAEKFHPKIIYIGPETGIAEVGIRLSRELKVPLFGYFMDWPTFAAGGHRFLWRALEFRYRKRYGSCDLALCICSEMRSACGEHPNSHVCYPSTSGNLPEVEQLEANANAAEPTLVFSGNLGQWYGLMLTRLAGEFLRDSKYKLQITGSCPSWGPSWTKTLIEQGVYIGYVEQSHYASLLQRASALLVIMGFDSDAERVERTSFKSKLAEYLKAGRPVIVWGPAYCTAVRNAQCHGFALTVVEPDPSFVLQAFKSLLADKMLEDQLVAAGHVFYQNYLSMEKNAALVHGKIYELIESGGAHKSATIQGENTTFDADALSTDS